MYPFRLETNLIAINVLQRTRLLQKVAAFQLLYTELTIQGTKNANTAFLFAPPTMKQFKTIITAVLLIFFFCFTEGHGFLENTCDARLNPNNCNEHDQLRLSRAKENIFIDARNQRISGSDQTNMVTTQRSVRNADRDADVLTSRNVNDRETRQILSTRDTTGARRMSREDFNERRSSTQPNENRRNTIRQEGRITERLHRRTAEESRVTAERRLSQQTPKEDAFTQERRFNDVTRRERAIEELQNTRRTSEPSSERLFQQQTRASEEQISERRTIRNARDQSSFDTFRSNRRIFQRNKETSDRRLQERQIRADQEKTSDRRIKDRRNAADTIKNDRRVSQRNKDIVERRELHRMQPEERMPERTFRRATVEQRRTTEDRQVRRMQPEERRLERSTRRATTVEQRRTTELNQKSRRVADRNNDDRRIPETRDERIFVARRATRYNNDVREETSMSNRVSAQDNLRRSSRIDNRVRVVSETAERMDDDSRIARNARVDPDNSRQSTASPERTLTSRNTESANRLSLDRQTIRNTREALTRSHRALERNAARDSQETLASRRNQRLVVDTERSAERRSNTERRFVDNSRRHVHQNEETKRFAKERSLERNVGKPEQDRRQAERESFVAVNRVAQLRRNTPKDENKNDRSREASTRDVFSIRFENSGRKMAISSRVVEPFTKTPEYIETSNDYWLTAAKTFLATLLVVQVVAHSKSKKYG